jgi:hypothetical protein
MKSTLPGTGEKARAALLELESQSVETIVGAVTAEIQRLRATGRVADGEIAVAIAESEGLPEHAVLRAVQAIPRPPGGPAQPAYHYPRAALGRMSTTNGSKVNVSADRIRDVIEGIARDLRLKTIRLAEQPDVQEALVQRLPELAALPRHERHRKVLDAYLKRGASVGASVVSRNGKREIVFG